jgi:hypothetical protein
MWFSSTPNSAMIAVLSANNQNAPANSPKKMSRVRFQKRRKKAPLRRNPSW